MLVSHENHSLQTKNKLERRPLKGGLIAMVDLVYTFVLLGVKMKQTKPNGEIILHKRFGDLGW